MSHPIPQTSLLWKKMFQIGLVLSILSGLFLQPAAPVQAATNLCGQITFMMRHYLLALCNGKQAVEIDNLKNVFASDLGRYLTIDSATITFFTPPYQAMIDGSNRDVVGAVTSFKGYSVTSSSQCSSCPLLSGSTATPVPPTHAPVTRTPTRTPAPPSRTPTSAFTLCGYAVQATYVDFGGTVAIFLACNGNTYIIDNLLGSLRLPGFYTLVNPVLDPIAPNPLVQAVNPNNQVIQSNILAGIDRVDGVRSTGSCGCTFTQPVITKTPTRTPTRTLTSTATRTFTPTVTSTFTPSPTVTLTPTSVVDLEKARQLIRQKNDLANQMSSRLTLENGVFALPALAPPFNETRTRELLSRLDSQVGKGTLTPAEIDGLERLVIQEKALLDLLKSYAAASTATAKPVADTVKIFAGLKVQLAVISKMECKGSVCYELLKQARKVAWDIIRSYTRRLAAELGGGNAGAGAVTEMVDKALILLQDRVTRGESLMDLFKDTAVEILETNLFVNHYIQKMQPLVDQGADTAGGFTGGKKWPITGNSKLSQAQMDDITQRARWSAESSIQRSKDFAKSTELASTVQDITELGSITGIPLVSQFSLLAGLTTRIERFLINQTNTWLNIQDQNCISYLSERAAEIAFNANVPGEDCKYMNKTNKPAPDLSLVSYKSRPLASPLNSALHTDSANYAQAVQKLVAAAQAKSDDGAFGAAIEQLIAAKDRLSASIEKSQMVVYQRGAIQDADQAFLASSLVFQTGSLGLYLAAASVSQARESSGADLSQVANISLRQVAELDATANQVNLTPPANAVLVHIQGVSLAPSGSMLQAKVDLENIGKISANDLQLQVRFTGHTSASALEALGPGMSRSQTLQIPYSSSLTAIDVEVWSGGKFIDQYAAEVPLAATTTTTLPATVNRNSQQPSQAVPFGLFSGAAGVAVLMVLFAVTGVIAWVVMKRKKTSRG